MLVDLSVQDLYWRSASIEPAPGGGSVTALCGMLGVALVLKALRISMKRRDDADQFRAADQALEALAEALAADAEADAESFNAFILAVRMPKAGPEEAAERARNLQQAAIGSTEAGLLALEHALEAMNQARALAPVIGEQMAPDLDAGLRLLEVTRANAIHNAEANLQSVKAEDRRAALAERLRALGS